MTAIVIIGRGELSQEAISEIATMIQKANPFEILDITGLNDNDLQQALVARANLGSSSPQIREVINLEKIKAAAVYLIENFGDPEDTNTEAFRVRIQKEFWQGSPFDEHHQRTRTALEIFSKIHKAKLPQAVKNYLKETNLAFMPEWANTIFRYEHM